MEINLSDDESDKKSQFQDLLGFNQPSQPQAQTNSKSFAVKQPSRSAFDDEDEMNASGSDEDDSARFKKR